MIDVQIVAYGAGDDLRAAVASARAVAGAHVIVVDHRGDVGGDVAADEVLVDVANPGFGAGHNRALRDGAAPWVLLMNPDCVVDPGGIAAGLRHLEDDGGIALVQGVVLGPGGTPDRSAGVELTPLHLAGRALRLRGLLRLGAVRVAARAVGVLRDYVERGVAEPTEVASLAATAVLARRSALEQVGGFDESFFLYGEDLDLCRRLRAVGWRLVTLPVPWAAHVGGGTSASTWDRELRWWEGTLRFAALWWATASWWAAEAAAAIVAVRLLVRRPRAIAIVGRAFFTTPRRARAIRRSPASAPAPSSPTSKSPRQR